MDIPTLLHSLTVSGLSLRRGEADSLQVVGPVEALTHSQREALSEHKPTLLAMLPPPPTCYLPNQSKGQAELESDLKSLKEAFSFFDELANEMKFFAPDRLSEIMLEPEPQEVPCPRCGNRQTYLAILHKGESLRRDCARCGRFLDFPSWHNRGETAKILAYTQAKSRYNQKRGP